MVYVTMRAGGDAPWGYQYGRRIAAYAAGAALAAAAFGAVLGWIGERLSVNTTADAVVPLATLALIVGTVEAIRGTLWLPQRNRETPQRWVRYGAIPSAVLNGGALGIGIASRLGYGLWFVLPVAAILVSDVLWAITIFTTYGLTRALGLWTFIIAARRVGDLNRVGDTFLERRVLVRRFCGLVLAGVGSLVLLTSL